MARYYFVILFISICFLGCEKRSVPDVILYGDIVELQKRIDSGLDVNTVFDKEMNMTLLKMAISSGGGAGGASKHELVQMLIDNGANVNSYMGESPVAKACRNSEKEIVELLLSYGAKIDPLQEDETPALVLAVINTEPDFIFFLLSKGASVNVADHRGLTPLHAVMYRNNATLVKKLLDAGADVNAVMKDGGHTPLHLAIRYKCELDTFQLLVDHGAKVDIKNSEGLTITEYAKKEGRDDVLAIIKN